MNSRYLYTTVKACGLFFILFFSFFFLYDILHPETIEKTNKTLSFKGSVTTGYTNGTINWKLFTDELWSKESRSVIFGNQILAGVIYDHHSRIIVDTLRANTFRIQSDIKKLMVSKGVSAHVYMHPNSNKASFGLIAAPEDTSTFIITANELIYSSQTEETHLINNISVQRQNDTIYPFHHMKIDHKNNHAYVNDGFTIRSPSFSVTGNRVTININQNESFLAGNLHFTYLAHPSPSATHTIESNLRHHPAILMADAAHYIEKQEKKQLFVSQNVVLTHQHKTITAQEGHFDQLTSTLHMNRDVSIHVKSLLWALNPARRRQLRHSDITHFLNKKTHIRCNQFIFNQQKEESILIGDVKLNQVDLQISCHKLIYASKNEYLECIGNATVIKEGRNTLAAPYLKIFLKDEVFSATKGVQATYHLKEN